MQDKFRVHDAARIRTGKYAGLVGTVTDTRSDGEKQTQVRVNAEGVRDGVAVAGHVWLKRSAVERNING